jgi:hypothetical protein
VYKTEPFCQLPKICFVREVSSNHKPLYAVH